MPLTSDLLALLEMWAEMMIDHRRGTLRHSSFNIHIPGVFAQQLAANYEETVADMRQTVETYSKGEFSLREIKSGLVTRYDLPSIVVVLCPFDTPEGVVRRASERMVPFRLGTDGARNSGFMNCRH